MIKMNLWKQKNIYDVFCAVKYLCNCYIIFVQNLMCTIKCDIISNICNINISKSVRTLVIKLSNSYLYNYVESKSRAHLEFFFFHST